MYAISSMKGVSVFLDYSLMGKTIYYNLFVNLPILELFSICVCVRVLMNIFRHKSLIIPDYSCIPLEELLVNRNTH